MIPDIILYPVLLFLFGCCMGSFLNVVIWRLPHHISFIHPGSMCPGCGRELTPAENIPVLSWILLLGKCKGCHARIHWRYPGVELLTGLLWAFYGYATIMGWNPTVHMQGELIQRTSTMVMGVWFISYMVAIIFIDYDLTIIPDELNFSGIIIALIGSYFLPNLHPAAQQWFPIITDMHLKSLLASGIGALVGGGMLLLLTMIGTLAYRKKIKKLQEEDPDIVTAIGLGDVKLMAFVGAFIGWKETIVAFFLGTCLGAFIGLAVKIKTGNSLIPYGPFLCAGTLLVMMFHDPLFAFISERFWFF